MKKIIFSFLLLSSLSISAQKEIRLDIADALVLKSLDLSYEHYITDASSFGVSALFNFEGKGSDFRYNENQMVTPFFRHYFTTEAMWNFFGEVWMGLNFGEHEVGPSGSNTFEKYTDGALGVGIGSKYISDGGFVIDIHGGLGRNLFGSDSPIIVPRVGVGIGFRF